MASPKPIVHLYYGQDEPGLRQALAEFCAKLGEPASLELNTTRLDGKTISAGLIEATGRALPFLAETRLVLVENLTESAAGRAVIDELSDLLKTLPDSSRLVFIETGLGEDDADGGDRKRLAGRQQVIRKLANLIENDPRGQVHVYDLPRDLVRWLQDRAKQHGVSLDPAAARRLAERLGNALVLADTEIAKLAAYTAGKRSISAADVDDLTPYAAEANIFHMVDALGQRSGEKAIRALRQLLDDGDEPLRIFALITRQYRLLLQIKELIEGGHSMGGAASALGLRDFVAKKLAEQARMYRLDQLERVMSLLLDTDIAIKTGHKDGQLALEELVVRLAGRG